MEKGSVKKAVLSTGTHCFCIPKRGEVMKRILHKFLNAVVEACSRRQVTSREVGPPMNSGGDKPEKHFEFGLILSDHLNDR